jgi:hypothetical protein
MDYIELGIASAMVALGAVLWAYIKKVKSRLRRFILRKN